MYLCVRGIDFASFYDFYIRFGNCSNSLVFCVLHFILTNLSRSEETGGYLLDRDKFRNTPWIHRILQLDRKELRQLLSTEASPFYI